MPIEFESDGNLAVILVTGKLKMDEVDKAQKECEALIKDIGKVKLLILSESFAGWEKGEGWGDLSFSERNDPYIEKIAFVGEEKWRDLIYAFTGKGLRPVPIEFFTPEQEDKARQWLERED
jgi:stage II sporulation SpoAA-like protein